MKKIQIWVSPSEKYWSVKLAGLGNISQATTQTQAEAREIGIRIAKMYAAEFVLQGRNGQIREKNSYNGDPFPPRG